MVNIKKRIEQKCSQFLLDAPCTLRVQDLEGAENNVLGVGAWCGQEEEVSYPLKVEDAFTN